LYQRRERWKSFKYLGIQKPPNILDEAHLNWLFRFKHNSTGECVSERQVTAPLGGLEPPFPASSSITSCWSKISAYMVLALVDGPVQDGACVCSSGHEPNAKASWSRIHQQASLIKHAAADLRHRASSTPRWRSAPRARQLCVAACAPPTGCGDGGGTAARPAVGTRCAWRRRRCGKHTSVCELCSSQPRGPLGGPAPHRRLRLRRTDACACALCRGASGAAPRRRRAILLCRVAAAPDAACTARAFPGGRLPSSRPPAEAASAVSCARPAPVSPVSPAASHSGADGAL
jgi:hypothetical protein